MIRNSGPAYNGLHSFCVLPFGYSLVGILFCFAWFRVVILFHFLFVSAGIVVELNFCLFLENELKIWVSKNGEKIWKDSGETKV